MSYREDSITHVGSQWLMRAIRVDNNNKRAGEGIKITTVTTPTNMMIR